MRKFKIGKEKFLITNVGDSSNLSEQPYKYDLNIFCEKHQVYKRVLGCSTLASGKELAIDYVYQLNLSI